MKVSIIGGTGFVGRHVLKRLTAEGHTARVLVRPGREHKLPVLPGCDAVSGEVGDEAALRSCLDGADAVIYLIGILRELPKKGITFDALQRRGAERTFDIARELGVSRALLMSANGIDAAVTPYQQTKLASEEALKASGLDWTIFRPSVIFGDPDGCMEFCSQLKSDLIDAPMPAPLFYRGLLPKDAGGFQLAPVHVDDVADAFVRSLGRAESHGQTYELCGPEALTWKEILTTIAAAVGKRKLMVPAPVMAIGSAAALLDRFSWFPVTRDQLTMLLAGNTCSDDGLGRLGIVPRAFDQMALSYLRES
jgi:NADH dehydrogenase